MKFFLGTDDAHWLWQQPFKHSLFVSTRRLARYKRHFKPSVNEWSLDSGGFTELNLFGKWETTPTTYVSLIRRYMNELGKLQWCAPQDWMCEPTVLQKTGKTVLEHQRLTVENFIELRNLASDLPIIPVLQGWLPDDYLRHRDLYDKSGIDLTDEALVGMGTFCRRASLRPVHDLVEQLFEDGLSMHGFGVKSDGLPAIGNFLKSADSLAWSLTARLADGHLCGGSHNAQKCSHCQTWATMWADRVIAKIGTRPYIKQLQLF